MSVHAPPEESPHDGEGEGDEEPDGEHLFV